MRILLPIIIILLWLEATITSLPLLLILVSVLVILYEEIWAASIAFFGGLILDSASVRPLGTTSAFLVCWLFLILLYQHKYEINSYPFIFASVFFGSWIFLILLEYDNALLQSIAGSFLAICLFWVLKRNQAETRNQTYREI